MRHAAVAADIFSALEQMQTKDEKVSLVNCSCPNAKRNYRIRKPCS
jgi:hypothetical protein